MSVLRSTSNLNLLNDRCSIMKLIEQGLHTLLLRESNNFLGDSYRLEGFGVLYIGK